MRCCFGERNQMLTEAHKRISSHPDKYVDHIYGEKEAGGTSVLYLSSVPFVKLGFPERRRESLSGGIRNSRSTRFLQPCWRSAPCWAGSSIC